MKITLLPSAMSESGIVPNQFLTTLLVNDRVAIDGGSIGLYKSPKDQAAIRHVFISHSHLDHWATLPIFIVNVFDMAPTTPTLYTSEVARHAARDVFSGRVWPELWRCRTKDGRSSKCKSLKAYCRSTSTDCTSAIAVNHAVPTLGFVIEDAKARS